MMWVIRFTDLFYNWLMAVYEATQNLHGVPPFAAFWGGGTFRNNHRLAFGKGT